MAQRDRFGNPLTLDDGCGVFSAYTRLDPGALQFEVSAVATSAVVDGMMKSVGGMMAIVNRYRQILTVNDSFFRELGITDPSRTVGLRLGEAAQCGHLDEAPHGCGTGRFCSSCGAAIAMVATICSNEPAEEKCVALFRKGEREVELCLKVRATPLVIGAHRVVMLFLQDVTEQELEAETRLVFDHDLGNIVAALAGGTDLLLNRVVQPDAAARVISRNLARLQQELAIQRAITAGESDGIVTQKREAIDVATIVDDVTDLLENHPAARGKLLKSLPLERNVTLHTNSSLLLRVLSNMMINAFEATGDGGEVCLSVEEAEGEVRFSVRNSQVIPQEIRPRIFQRFFSTKGGRGRGFGTYMMKRFGEQVMGGKVGFTTSETEGTTFVLTLPQRHLLKERRPA